MKWMKMLGVAAAAMLLLSVSAFAADDLSVSDAAGMLENGTVSYRAKVTNHTANEAKPIMVLVWFEDGVMQKVGYQTSAGIAAGASETMQSSISGIQMTDHTRITGFIWEDAVHTIPISLDEIKKKGSWNTNIAGISAVGMDADLFEIDTENKTVDVSLPLATADGSAVQLPDALDATIVLGDARSSVAVNGVALTGSGEEKTGTISLATGSEITVTAEDGTQATYQVAVNRSLKLDFENDWFKGESHGINGGSNVDGTFKVAESLSGMVNVAVGNVVVNSYTEQLFVGIKPITDALLTTGATTPIPVGASGASNNALMIAKKFHPGSGDEMGKNTGVFQMMIQNLPELAAATNLTIAYDVAVGLNGLTDAEAQALYGVKNRRQVGIGGLDFSVSGGSVRFTTTTTDDLSKAVLVANGNASNAVGTAVTTKVKANVWRHIEITVTKDADGKVSWSETVDGTPVEELSEACKGGWPTRLVFGGSGQRATDWWFDNIEISYR